LKRRYCSVGLKDPNKPYGETADKLTEVQSEKAVNYFGPLAGYRKGFTIEDGNRLLVTESPAIIRPAKGGFETLDGFFRGLLQLPEFDQISVFYGWLKIGYEALARNERRPGQALVLAGPAGAGKSLLQNLITEILGGRSAKCYRYMSGRTDFNGDLFGAEHLMVEDDQPSTDFRSRRQFGTNIKEITVNEVQSCHAKHRQAMSLKPFWRMTVSVNDEPENLMILPPVEPSIEDKLILLKCSKIPMLMPTRSIQERKAFRNKLSQELPAFIEFLNSWKIPEALISERFGVSHFHHPELIAALSELAPFMQLLVSFRQGCMTNSGRSW